MHKRLLTLAVPLALLTALAACGDAGKQVANVGVDWTGNDIAVEAVQDPDVKGVVCHVAYFNRSLMDKLQQGSGKMSLSVVSLNSPNVTWTNGLPAGVPAPAN